MCSKYQLAYHKAHVSLIPKLRVFLFCYGSLCKLSHKMNCTYSKRGCRIAVYFLFVYCVIPSCSPATTDVIYYHQYLLSLLYVVYGIYCFTYEINNVYNVHNDATGPWSPSMLHVILFPMLMFTFAFVLFELCVYCPKWLLSVVTGFRVF
jgi:hypothetical protein